jgi:NADPH2 dehydrogenase
LEEKGLPYVSASDVNIPMKVSSTNPLRPLTKTQIRNHVGYFATAARNSIKAGADGVEIHAANRYLPDQFMHEQSNKRTDEYGGASIESRCRFTLEIVDAMVEAVGASKVGIRFSPWNDFQDMDVGPYTRDMYIYLLSELEKRATSGNRIAYAYT